MKKYDKKTGYETFHENREKIANFFSWDEFYDRYVNNYEEFTFIYNNQHINLITDPKGFLYTIGTKQNGFRTSIFYKTPIDLLNNALFNGKSLKEIWKELE